MTVITIDDLTLRPIAETDAPRIASVCNDESLSRNTARIPFPYTLEDATRFVARAIREGESGEEYRFAICKDDLLIGCTGIMAKENDTQELGYFIAADSRGRGFATKAATAISTFGFDRLRAKIIEAGYFTDNPVSGRVLQKLGFKDTGEIIQTPSLARGTDVETARMRLLLSDFHRSQSVSIRP